MKAMEMLKYTGPQSSSRDSIDQESEMDRERPSEVGNKGAVKALERPMRLTCSWGSMRLVALKTQRDTDGINLSVFHGLPQTQQFANNRIDRSGCESGRLRGEKSIKY
jgi:hypothetical protein